MQKLASFQEFPQPENLSYYWPHALGGHTVKRFSKVKRNPVIEDPERGEVDDCDFQGSDPPTYNGPEEVSPMLKKLRNVLSNDEGQDIAEYAVMLAVILVLVIGTVRLIGGNANNAFSIVGSTLQGT